MFLKVNHSSFKPGKLFDVHKRTSASGQNALQGGQSEHMEDFPFPGKHFLFWKVFFETKNSRNRDSFEKFYRRQFLTDQAELLAQRKIHKVGKMFLKVNHSSFKPDNLLDVYKRIFAFGENAPRGGHSEQMEDFSWKTFSPLESFFETQSKPFRTSGNIFLV